MICDNLVKIWEQNLLEGYGETFLFFEDELAVPGFRFCQGCLNTKQLEAR